MVVYDESGHRIEEYDLDKGYLENKSEAVEHRWVVDSEEQGEWVTVNDMVNISGLMERLSLGSFAYQREFTIEALTRRYSREIILIAALIAATASAFPDAVPTS